MALAHPYSQPQARVIERMGESLTAWIAAPLTAVIGIAGRERDVILAIQFRHAADGRAAPVNHTRLADVVIRQPGQERPTTVIRVLEVNWRKVLIKVADGIQRNRVHAE